MWCLRRESFIKQNDKIEAKKLRFLMDDRSFFGVQKDYCIYYIVGCKNPYDCMNQKASFFPI